MASNANWVKLVYRPPNLKALHIENVRRVSDFSGLKNARSLEYLSIDGTFDWAQPVDSFEFLETLGRLEFLRLMNVRPPKSSEPLACLLKLKRLSKIAFGMSTFPLEVFAWIQAKIPRVEGAVRPAFVKFGGENREISPRDIRSRMPIEEFNRFPDLSIGEDGKRYQWIPHQAALLGRGQRGLLGTQESVESACARHAEKYRKLVERFSD